MTDTENNIAWQCFVVLMDAAQFRDKEIEPMGCPEIFMRKFKHKLTDKELEIAEALIKLN